MAIREYKCPDCGLLTERIIQASQEIPLVMDCPRCKGEAKFLEIPTGFSLGTSNFSNAPIDIVIGKDSERKWDNIHKRQEIRDKVRKESGVMGLSANNQGEFKPVSPMAQGLRAELNEILPKVGHKTSYDSPEDAKLINHK